MACSVRQRSYLCRRSCYSSELMRCRSSGSQHADLQTLPMPCSVERRAGTLHVEPA